MCSPQNDVPFFVSYQRALRSAWKVFNFWAVSFFLGCVGSVNLVNLRLIFQCDNNN